MMRGRSCFACEHGTVRPANLRGRVVDYRDALGLMIDEDLEAPVCDRCGEMYLKGPLVKRVNTVLERLRRTRKRDVVGHFVETAEREFPQVPRSLWEDALGLSRGYLSRLASGSRVPDTALEILLAAFARKPRLTLDLVVVAGHMPPELSRLVANK